MAGWRTLWTLGVCVIGAVTSARGCSPATAQAAQPSTVLSQCRDGAPDVAIPACTQIITDKAASAQALGEAYHRRAIAYYQQRKYDLAVADETKALEAAPAQTEPLLWRAFAHWGAGAKSNALQDLGAVLTRDAGHVNARVTRGWMRRDADDFEGAIADLTAAIALVPDLAIAYRDRGMTYVRLGYVDEALADTDKAVALDPSSGYQFLFRGRAREIAGRQAEAKADYEKVLALPNLFAWSTTSHDVARERLAALDGKDEWADCRGSEPERAIAACGRIIAHAYETRAVQAQAHLERGVRLRDRNDHARASADFDAAVRLDPANWWGYFQRGFSAFMLGRNEQAIADNTAALLLNPNSPHAHFNRGLAFANLGRCELASQDYTDVVRREPANIAAYVRRGECLVRLRKVAEAADDFRKALAATPGPGTWDREHQKIARTALDSLLSGQPQPNEGPAREPWKDGEEAR